MALQGAMSLFSRCSGRVFYKHTNTGNNLQPHPPDFSAPVNTDTARVQGSPRGMLNSCSELQLCFVFTAVTHGCVPQSTHQLKVHEHTAKGPALHSPSTATLPRDRAQIWRLLWPFLPKKIQYLILTCPKHLS